MKKNLTKKLSLFLSLMCIFICMLMITVFGSDTYNGDIDENGTMIESLDSYSGLENYLVNKLKAKTTGAIDVSAYNIEVAQNQGGKVALDLVNALLNKHPEIFYVNMNGGVGCTVRNNVIETITITKGYFSYDATEFDTEVKKVMSHIEDDMSELEKIMIVHNYLCMDVEYAYDEFVAGTVADKQHSALGAILEKKAVCDGYSKAFAYYMNKLGIECYVITGKATTNGSEINHAWNQVKLDSEWYFVDVSWDDPVPDWYGAVRYNYFLKSASDFSDHTWSVNDFEICDNRKYDASSNVFWKNVNDQMYCIDGMVYYLKDSDDGKKTFLVKHNLSTDALTAEGSRLFTIEDKWFAFPSTTSYYPGNYSRLGYADGKLYYSNKDTIFAYDIAKNTSTKVLDADTSKGYVYGMKVANGKLSYQTSKTPNTYDGVTKSFKLSELQGSTDTDISSATVKLSGKVKLSKTKYAYTGKYIKPAVTISGLKKGRDFKVSYSNNKNVGKATVTVTGIGKYKGTLKTTFTIVPKKVTLSKITAPKKKVLKITWKKTNGTGYQVVISQNKKFKNSKTYKVKGAKKLNLTIKKLASGKRYYVKVRAYKVVKGKTYTGAYSRILYKKVK
ncbi:MAG: hypothetical protein E7252_07125 [Lachnospira sp.]|nr:hypothetical protein [Lachnospira sp.]